MPETELTSRDEEYLRAIFLLSGKKEPISPSILAKALDITKVSSYQKMRRLEILGFGNYIPRKGFLLNSKGESLVEEDNRRHHVLEKFIHCNLGMSSNDACLESSRMGRYVSPALMRTISEKLGNGESCECGSCLKPPYNPLELANCHWCKSHLQKGIAQKDDGEVS